jgi:hypothetical protein
MATPTDQVGVSERYGPVKNSTSCCRRVNKTRAAAYAPAPAVPPRRGAVDLDFIRVHFGDDAAAKAAADPALAQHMHGIAIATVRSSGYIVMPSLASTGNKAAPRAGTHRERWLASPQWKLTSLGWRRWHGTRRVVLVESNEGRWYAWVDRNFPSATYASRDAAASATYAFITTGSWPDGAKALVMG